MQYAVSFQSRVCFNVRGDITLKKISTSRKAFQVFNYSFMIIICIICILPLWHVYMASFSDPALVESATGFILKPLGKITLSGYRILLDYKHLWRGYGNTIIYIILQCVISGILTLVTGYVVSRKEIRYRNALMMFMMFTMMFNGGTIPTYMVVRSLGLLDTRAALILPTAVSVFHVIIMRTGISSIPEALIESAKIDGAGTLKIIFKIILPLCKSTFAVIILFIAIFKWNEWYNALLYLPSATDKYPLQMVLREILILNNTDASTGADLISDLQLSKTLVKYCAITVSTLPIICFYPFVQKYFVTGVMIGSVKG